MNRAHRRQAAKGKATSQVPLVGQIKAPASRRRLRASWYSNAPFSTATGYANQTAQVVPRMAADGHELAILANYGIEGFKIDWNGIPVFPKGLADYSDDVMGAHHAGWVAGNRTLPNVLFTLFDVWVFKSEALKQVERIASWVPIDHQPGPPLVIDWCKRENVTPIAMSRFGVEMLEREDVKCEYAPHAVEDVFKPTPSIPAPDGSRVTGRDLIGVDDDKFVVLMNSANKGVTPSRKSFGENIMAFAVFAERHPDALLYLHTEVFGSMGGMHLPDLCKACGISPDQYRVVDQYQYRAGFQQDALAAIYTASDVHLNCSMGEGFGIPTVEAQACGTRVIVSNWTAQPELVGDGWIVEGQPWWDVAQKAWFITPHVNLIVDALEAAYEAPRGVSENAVTFAEDYRADAVYAKYWRPILDRLAA